MPSILLPERPALYLRAISSITQSRHTSVTCTGLSPIEHTIDRGLSIARSVRAPTAAVDPFPGSAFSSGQCPCSALHSGQRPDPSRPALHFGQYRDPTLPASHSG